MTPRVVSNEQWHLASLNLLAVEKDLTRRRDELSAMRRALPWVRVDKRYTFDGRDGEVSLLDLFDGRRQLIVKHFMFAPEWDEGCVGCSFSADSADAARLHFEHDDTSFAAISRAPIGKLETYRKRMGWTFQWVSSGSSDFNYDFRVSFTEEERAAGTARWNFDKVGDPGTSDVSGVSAFVQDDGAIYHTYSTFGRGGEDLLLAYAYLDIVPLGRNEDKDRQPR